MLFVSQKRCQNWQTSKQKKHGNWQHFPCTLTFTAKLAIVQESGVDIKKENDFLDLMYKRAPAAQEGRARHASRSPERIGKCCHYDAGRPAGREMHKNEKGNLLRR